MESGSLLPIALQYGQTLRQTEQGIEAGSDAAFSPIPGEQNSLLLSIYLIESDDQICKLEAKSHRISLMQRLAHVHSIIHKKLLPVYRKRCHHSWFTGGDGMTFGLHCDTATTSTSLTTHSDTTSEESIPHLRSVIHYGPHILDELWAIALMFQLSIDLQHQYNIRVAITCIDAQDGQILLLEGDSADDIPSWVDDIIGVQGMERRVYIVQGQVVLVPPNVKSADPTLQSYQGLTRKESLLAMKERYNTPSIIDTSARNTFRLLNQSIRTRLEPFRHVLETGTISSALKEYTHTSAVVLPLQLALVVKERPDLVPCAIRTFCRLALDKLDKKQSKTMKRLNSTATTTDTTIESPIPFENLVVTTINLPKTLYAMLLTAAGQLPPPLSIPKHYKSMEMKRMRRKCCPSDAEDEFFGHFRHSMEVGMRLSLGFEWTLQQTRDKVKKSAVTDVGVKNTSKNSSLKKASPREENSQRSIKEYSREERICDFHSRIDVEAGGDGEWLHRAWSKGPNETPSSETIEGMMDCPVWEPEVQYGGICPLSQPGKSIRDHVRTSLDSVTKSDLSTVEIANTFPLPRGQDVDSDAWIDLNSMDEVEMRIQDTIRRERSGTGALKPKDEKSGESSCNDITKNDEKLKSDNEPTEEKLGNVVESVHDFVFKDKSGFEGIEDKRRKGVVTGKPAIQINPRVFLHVLHKALKVNADPSKKEEMISLHDDEGLLQYFTKQDLEYDDVDSSDDDSKDGHGMDEDENEMSEIMRAMDEDLYSKSKDRNISVEESLQNELKGTSVDKDTMLDINLLSNLLQSIDAQEDDGRGPVDTLLTGMGVNQL